MVTATQCQDQCRFAGNDPRNMLQAFNQLINKKKSPPGTWHSGDFFFKMESLIFQIRKASRRASTRPGAATGYFIGTRTRAELPGICTPLVTSSTSRPSSFIWSPRSTTL